LDTSVIDEMPPGRKPVTTRDVPSSKIQQVWKFVGERIAAGEQAYVVYPAIEESETQVLKVAVAAHEHLSKVVFPNATVSLLHGKLKADEKDSIMSRFQRGEIQLLVATTVIEVGVDVPRATVMVIEHAERFGLAQLHQLRGRVGRGAAQSYCILVTDQLTETGRERIDTLVRSNDGFHIAEVDLKLRGPGEFFGTKQSGVPALKIANLVRDREILELARMDAAGFVEKPPGEQALKDAVAYIRDHWQRRYGLVQIG
jgi:ATP-dependent DNA helicase RecG